MKYKALLYFLGAFITLQPMWGQEVDVPEHIKSVQMTTTREELVPILAMGEHFTLSFDDLHANEEDYYYTITHCDFNWEPSQMHKSEYLSGMDELRINNVSNSFSTIVQYTHYELTIPNAQTKLLLTGNYILSILNSSFEVVFTRRFVVYTSSVGVKMGVYQSRDASANDQLQVVQFSVLSTDVPLEDPLSTLKVAVLQNHDFTQAITKLKPQYILGREVVYKYDAPASFLAGNEYLNFDNSDIFSTGKGVYSSRLEDEGYHSYLFTDIHRGKLPYTYNPDINGAYRIGAVQSRGDSDLQAEYVWVHFSLSGVQTEAFDEVYVYGDFSNKSFHPSNRLYYNPESKTFEGKILLKQGFYNYRYGLKRNGVNNLTSIGGNYYQTENEYTIIVYYRPNGALYDRVIGVSSLFSTQVGRY